MFQISLSYLFFVMNDFNVLRRVLAQCPAQKSIVLVHILMFAAKLIPLLLPRWLSGHCVPALIILV